MKIRNGFVSNSSSSSFCLIGELVDINDLTPEDLKENTYMTDTGKYWDYPIWADLDGPDILEYLQKEGKGKTYLVHYITYEDCGNQKIDITKLPQKELNVVCDTMAQGRVDNDNFEELKYAEE